MTASATVRAYVWAARMPGVFSFNTQPMTYRQAVEYAVALIEDGRSLVRVSRASCAANFLTDDVLIEMRS